MPVEETGPIAPRTGRRLWSGEQKRRIVEETLVPGVSVSAVARRHDVNANLLFTWRRQAGHGRGGARTAETPIREPAAPMEFVQLGVVSGEASASASGRALSLPGAKPPRGPAVIGSGMSPPPQLNERAGAIEIALPGGARIRVDASVDQDALRRVLQVMKDVS